MFHDNTIGQAIKITVQSDDSFPDWVTYLLLVPDYDCNIDVQEYSEEKFLEKWSVLDE